MRIKKYQNTPGPLTLNTGSKDTREAFNRMLLKYLYNAGVEITDGEHTYKPYATVYPDVYEGYRNDPNNPDNPLLIDEFYLGDDGMLHVRKKAIPFEALNQVYVRDDGVIRTTKDLDKYTYNYNYDNKLLLPVRYHTEEKRLPYHDTFRNYLAIVDEYGNTLNLKLIGDDDYQDPADNGANDLMFGLTGIMRHGAVKAGEQLARGAQKAFEMSTPSTYMGTGIYTTPMGMTGRSLGGALADTALASSGIVGAANAFKDNMNFVNGSNLALASLPLLPIRFNSAVKLVGDLYTNNIEPYIFPYRALSRAINETPAGYRRPMLNPPAIISESTPRTLEVRTISEPWQRVWDNPSLIGSRQSRTLLSRPTYGLTERTEVFNPGSYDQTYGGSTLSATRQFFSPKRFNIANRLDETLAENEEYLIALGNVLNARHPRFELSTYGATGRNVGTVENMARNLNLDRVGMLRARFPYSENTTLVPVYSTRQPSVSESRIVDLPLVVPQQPVIAQSAVVPPVTAVEPPVIPATTPSPVPTPSIPIDLHSIIQNARPGFPGYNIITNRQALQLINEGYTPEEILSHVKVEYPLPGEEAAGFRANPTILRNIVRNAYADAGEPIPSNLMSQDIAHLRGIRERIGDEMHSGSHGTEWWFNSRNPNRIFDFFYQRRLHPRLHDDDLTSIARTPYIGTVLDEIPGSFSSQSLALAYKLLGESLGTLRLLLPAYGKITRGELNSLGNVGEYNFSGVDRSILNSIVKDGDVYKIGDLPLSFELDPESNVLIKNNAGEVLGTGYRLSKLEIADLLNARLEKLFTRRRYRGSDGQMRTVKEVYEDPNGYFQSDPNSTYRGVSWDDFLDLFRVKVINDNYGREILEAPSLGGMQFMKKGNKIINRNKLIKRKKWY